MLGELFPEILDAGNSKTMVLLLCEYHCKSGIMKRKLRLPDYIESNIHCNEKVNDIVVHKRNH